MVEVKSFLGRDGWTALARRKRLHLQVVVGIFSSRAQILVNLLVLSVTLSFNRKLLIFSISVTFVQARVGVIPAVSSSLGVSSVVQRGVTCSVLTNQIAVDAILRRLPFGSEELLPDEHAGDDEAVQTQQAVQEVTHPRVVRRQGLCRGKHRGEDQQSRNPRLELHPKLVSPKLSFSSNWFQSPATN